MLQKQLMLVVFILLVSINKDIWKNIKTYYRSLGYVMFVNALYYYLCKRYLLWEFTPRGLGWRTLRALHIFIITPLIVLLNLSTFPATFGKQIIHILKLVLVSTCIESIVVKEKMLKFKHGWSLYWSALIYIKMYVFSYIHTKKPRLTWFLTYCSLLFFIIKFRIPLKSKRFTKGPFVFYLKRHPSRFNLCDYLFQ